MNPIAIPRFHRHALRLLGTGVFVALAGTTMPSAQAAPMDGHRHGGMMGGPMAGHHGGMTGGMAGGMMSGPRAERMLEAAGASAEQRAQIKQIMDAARADLQAQRESGRALHEQMRQLFTQPTVDANVAEALRQQQLARHDAASKRMMQAMIDASRVLTPEQRAKLAEMVAHRRGMMERRGTPK
jgi:Spy/CpxP family protein refolding chaperone